MSLDKVEPNHEDNDVHCVLPQPNASVTCHYCKASTEGCKLVRCKNGNCGLCYCRKCLTGQYKYSKRAAKALPTPTWKCPRCTNKCVCREYDLVLIL